VHFSSTGCDAARLSHKKVHCHSNAFDRLAITWTIEAVHDGCG
jgi:hypothetical protein